MNKVDQGFLTVNVPHSSVSVDSHLGDLCSRGWAGASLSPQNRLLYSLAVSIHSVLDCALGIKERGPCLLNLGIQAALLDR